MLHVNIQTGSGVNATVPCTGFMVSSGDQIPLVYTNLSNPTVSAYFMKAIPSWGGAGGNSITGYAYTIGRDDYKLNKVALNHQSIDSRRGYGQPNIDGSTMADANADARNVSFANWIYKGGLFIGNLPFTTGDYSGTSRIQLTVPSTSFTDPRAESLTLLSLGGSNSVQPNFSIDLWKTTLASGQYDYGSSLTWATKVALPSGSPFIKSYVFTLVYALVNNLPMALSSAISAVVGELIIAIQDGLELGMLCYGYQIRVGWYIADIDQD